MNRPLFPVGEAPDVGEVADWCEYVALAEGEFKRGDLKSAVAGENIKRPELLEQNAWAELTRRDALFGTGWLLAMERDRLKRSGTGSVNLLLYKYLCLLSFADPEDVDRRLFEELVRFITMAHLGRNAFRIGHPASAGLSKSFRERVVVYSRRADLKAPEIKSAPLPHDKDLGLDVVGWLAHRDRRGGAPHFLIQCATGANWETKFHDIHLPTWYDHLYWALPPIRVFCTPAVARMSEEIFIRSSRQAGWIIDRPRIVEMAETLALSRRLIDGLTDRVDELEKP